MHYPRGWDDYSRVVINTGSDFFGFTDSVGNVNRFAARYRAARSFVGVTLDEYSEFTERGYSALVRIMLVYSAFEAFMDISARDQKKVGVELSACGANALIEKVREADRDRSFYKFLYERVNPVHKRELDGYFNEDPFNVAYMASAVRHIFAHGWLTPNVNGADAGTVAYICDEISEFLLAFMNKTFSGHVESSMRKIYGL